MRASLARTPLLGGSADSTADRPTNHLSPLWSPYKSSTFPPLLLCCPQAHKASFSMLLLASGGREASSEVYCGWSKAVRTNARGPTRTAHCSASTGSTTKLLFLPEWYMCSICFQLNKCGGGRTRLRCLHFPWALSSCFWVSGVHLSGRECP